jgi:hypothetical protein
MSMNPWEDTEPQVGFTGRVLMPGESEPYYGVVTDVTDDGLFFDFKSKKTIFTNITTSGFRFQICGNQ